MDLAAVEPKRDWVPCGECGGRGEGECIGGEHDDWSWQTCAECKGSGEAYVGRSGEPEDYPENDQ